MLLYLGKAAALDARAPPGARARDERLSLFAVPLGVNVMFCFGLLPFVFGFPMMLLALAAAVHGALRAARRSGPWGRSSPR